jgi:hypothetical protein
MKAKVLIDICSSLLIILFLYVSISKLMDVPQYKHDMHNQPFPYFVASALVWFVPAAEVTIVALLLFKKTNLLGMYASFILMTLFTLYIIFILLHFFSRVPCSCGGVIKKLGWGEHLIFNLFFVGVSLAGILLSKTKMKADQPVFPIASPNV